MKTSVKKLSVESFFPYGTFAGMINPTTIKMGKKPIEFYRDMLQLDLGGKSIASFSVCRVSKRPSVVDVSEYHTSCGEGVLPLNSDVVIHVGPAMPNGEVPLDKIVMFHVPKGTMVVLRPGVWHHAPFAYRSKLANVLIVLPERIYANDCNVYQIPATKQVKF
jgi:ureidoglycolate lyase